MGDAAAALLQRAEAALQERRLGSALRGLDAAEDCGAEADRCAGGRWMAHMLGGVFAAAWRESDAIRARGGEDPHRFWNGEDLRGKRVMVRCLHGFGDAVQMVRYAPLLRRGCADVTWEVAPRLVDLARCAAGVERVVTWGEGAPDVAPEWDVQVEVMELPYIFRTEVGTLPAPARFGSLPAGAVERARREVDDGDGLRVGVVWAAGEWNRARGMPFGCVEEMVREVGVTFWSLQGGAAAEQWRTLPAVARWRDAAVCGDGLVALAAFVAELDLVITVDTLAAHLAGSLGVPCWLLLQRAADWRWMVERTDSPWYGSMRLFRQGIDGDWSGVVAEVRRALRERVAAGREGKAA